MNFDVLVIVGIDYAKLRLFFFGKIEHNKTSVGFNTKTVLKSFKVALIVQDFNLNQF